MVLAGSDIDTVRVLPRPLASPSRDAFAWRFRLFDLLIVALAAPIVLVALAVILLVVKLDDPRSPTLYSQTRYGRHGKPFRLYKVRSMVPDADMLKAPLVARSVDRGAGFKLVDDPRVTRPGRILRRSYLDELPQLWNVLSGDMALVGPRANSLDPDRLELWQWRRLSVRPGITGSWQVMLDKPRDFAERCRIDLRYIRQKSLRLDLTILLRTMYVMFVRPSGE